MSSCNGTRNIYDISDPVELLATMTLASSDDPHDPPVVQLKILSPDYILSTYVYGTDPELIKDATGHYSLIIQPSSSGPYTYRWEAQDSSDDFRSGAQEAQFVVRYSSIVQGVPGSSAGSGSGSGVDGGTP